MKGFAHESHAIKSVEWYTPPWIFEELGLEFDLDPCHPKLKLPWLPAKHTYTIDDDGLSKPWVGNVWMNPPYGKFTYAWMKKMHCHRQGIALVFSRTDCKWYHDFVAKSDAILFLKGRIRFVDGNGKTGGSGAGSGSMLVAWGEVNVSALQRMSSLGHFVKI